MPSYLSYMRQMTVMDADDDNIESWITVRGNHIPIMKGQSKEDAVKSFVEKKGKGGSSEKVDNEKIKKAITKVGSAVNERKADEKTTIKNLTKEMGLNETETKKLNDFFGTGEQHATTRNIMTLFSKHYEDLYDGKTKSNRELVKEFDDKMANDPEFKKQVQAFVRERGDVLSSDREVQAYMMAYNTTKSKLEPAMKKLERTHGQTITQLKEAGKDISKLQQAMQHINYGFYEEQGKNMTPQQLVDYLQGEIDKSYGKKDYYSSRVQTRYPEAIKLVKEYINGGSDGSVKERATTKQSDSPLVNAVARSLNMSAENAEKEVNGAVQHIKDLIKAKDLRNGDVEETLQGLGIESDYAEEFMEWVSAPTKKKATTSKKKKEPAIVREGGVNWVDEKAWNDPRSDPWYALYE